MQGWLAAPLTSFICPVLLFALSRGTPILAEGIAVARSVCFWLLGFFLGKLKSVRFAFLATGLDAVQRLEQKKSRSIFLASAGAEFRRVGVTNGGRHKTSRTQCQNYTNGDDWHMAGENQDARILCCRAHAYCKPFC